MPATETDIAGASRAAVIVEWSSAAVKARYPSARDGRASPREGFFDTVADAQAAIDAEGALLGTERRVFAVEADGIVTLDPSTGTPTVRLVDAEQRVDGLFLVSRIEIDLEAERTSLELFG